ncbi:MAG TPA: helix-turn-helix transcriptional regulator [Polyangiaceae bacterium]|nr:helix-turn-helix transcriptional regulator [Polyangiaceae bacterium]
MSAISQRIVSARILVTGETRALVEAWYAELEAVGAPCVAAHGVAEARRVLSSERIRLAIVEAGAEPGRFDPWPENQRRPRVLFLMTAFDADVAVGLARAGDLVLPAALGMGTLPKAVRMLCSPDDEVVDFSRKYRLSPRETELLRLALLGKNNDEAAAELNCGRGTVSTFWNRIFKKTKVSGQRDVIVLLLRSSQGDTLLEEPLSLSRSSANH